MDDNSTSQLSLEDCWAIVVRRRWWVIAPIFLGWALALVSTHFMTKKYRSETMILVEQQRVPQHYVVPNIDADLQQRLQSMIQQILSRTRLQKIIDDLRPYEAVTNSDPDVLVGRMREDIKIDLIKGRARGDELSAFKVSYSARSALLAQQVTSRITSLFIEENLRNRQKQSEDTTAFLETQLEAARTDLSQQEARLQEFKGRHLGQLPQQLESNVRILSGLQDRLQNATAVLNQAHQQKLYLESLRSQYAGAAEVVPVPTSGAMTKAQQLQLMREQLADLEARYKDKHPDLLALRARIAQAEQALASTGEPDSSGVPLTAAVSANGAPSHIMQIESQLKANALEIENRRTELRHLETEIDRYQARLNLTPVTEQQLSAITRDHEQSRNNYESLLAKKMQSQLATNLEKQQQGEQFRIIDPPSLPQRPYSPDRLQFSLIGLAVGLALSLAMITLREMLSPRVYSDRHIDASLALLGQIPSIRSESEQSRAQMRLVLESIAASIMLLTMPAVSAFVYYRG